MRAGRGAFLLSCMIAAVCAAAPAQSAPEGGDVYVLTYEGVINPASADYIFRGIHLAEEGKASCLVLRLNTPGGLVSTTRDIVRGILAARVPVVAYVWPSGGHAASAGTFIVLASHVAAMAPVTNIGAAGVVIMGGGPGEGQMPEEILKTVKDKATNDLVAYIRSIATKRKRNVDWAATAVLESAAISAEDAVQKNVVDLLADDLDDLLTRIDGRTVETAAGEAVLHTKGATVHHVPITTREKVLAVLGDPNVSYILMMLAMLGIILEVNAPGLGGGGILSAICMILALYGLAVLKVNYAALALIILAIGFFIIEIKVPSHGLLIIGGVVSLGLGSLMLFEAPGVPAALTVRVSTSVVIAAVLSLAGFFLFCVYFAVKGHRRPVVTGQEGMVGMIGVARSDIGEEGRVFADSTLWTAESVEGLIPAGAKVQVVSTDGLRLKVKPYRETDATVK